MGVMDEEEVVEELTECEVKEEINCGESKSERQIIDQRRKGRIWE